MLCFKQHNKISRQYLMKTKNSSKSGSVGILIAPRRREKDKVAQAVKKQKEIKRKYGIPEKGWNSLSELRRVRASH